MLDSILQQTYRDFYVIIYDNGSVDNTEEVVRPYLQDDRFSYHKFPLNAKKNALVPFEQCDTEYFIWAHDDDVMLPDMIKEELFILENNKEIGIVTVNSNIIDEWDRILEYSVYNRISINDLLVPKQGYFDLFIAEKNFVCCPSVMYRMPLMRKYSICLHNEYGGACDIFQWMEINQYCSMYYISKTLFNYRRHKNQDSQNTLILDPLLKKPVFYFLNNYINPSVAKKKWLKFINRRIINELLKSKNIPAAYKTMRHAIFIPQMEEFVFRFMLYFLIFVPFSRPQMKIYKKIRRIFLRIMKKR
jgi:glycosyltransferase involved in cell wall biosynthesis